MTTEPVPGLPSDAYVEVICHDTVVEGFVHVTDAEDRQTWWAEGRTSTPWLAEDATQHGLVRVRYRIVCAQCGLNAEIRAEYLDELMDKLWAAGVSSLPLSALVRIVSS